MSLPEIELNKQVSMEELFQNTILADTSVPKNNIPDAVFKEHFLDFFMNKVEDTNKSQEITATWITKVAGSPTAEVNVTNEQGEVVFTVPSIFNTSILKLTTEVNKPPVGDVHLQKKNSQIVSTAVGQEDLKNTMIDQANQITKAPVINQHRNDQFSKMMEYYGIDSGGNAKDPESNLTDLFN